MGVLRGQQSVWVAVYATCTVSIGSNAMDDSLATSVVFSVAADGASFRVKGPGGDWLQSGAPVLDNVSLVRCAEDPSWTPPSQTRTGINSETGWNGVGAFTRYPDVTWCSTTSTTPVVTTSIVAYPALVRDVGHDDASVTAAMVVTLSFPNGLPDSGGDPALFSRRQRITRAAFPTLHAPSASSGGAADRVTVPDLNAFTFWGPSGMYTELNRLWAPEAFANTGDCDDNDFGSASSCDGMGPMVIYSNATPPNALVISAGSQFLSHQSAVESASIRCGVRGTVRTVPRGFNVSTVLVAGRGITKTVRDWGWMLLRQRGRDARVYPGTVYDRDPSLRYLSYWTDAGAAYYYATDRQNGTAEQTMKDVKEYMIENGIPMRVMQFDSWFYPKDNSLPGGPVTRWEPLESEFPDGFKPWLDIEGQKGAAAGHTPLVMHNRAFSPRCAYNKTWFVIEEKLALPVQPELFKNIMAKAIPLGLKVYEQDWICLTHMKMKSTQENVVDAARWFAAMDDAATSLNLTIQLCMMYSRHVLQTVDMDAVTQARASTDYHPVGPTANCKLGEPNPTCTQWNIGLTGLIYSSLGIAPSKDNFRTSMTAESGAPAKPELNPLLQTLVAGLSGGPVGPSDAIGELDFTLVHHISRGPDGYLNKPDNSATPIDLSFNLGFDDFGAGLDSLPTIWSAQSKVNDLAWGYVLVVDLARPISVTGADLGLPADQTNIVFEYFAECWRNTTAAVKGLCNFEAGVGHTLLVLPNDTVVLDRGGVRGNGSVTATPSEGTPFRYFISAPVLSSGWSLLGETGKFFPATRDRIRSFSVASGGIHAVIQGAPNEGVKIECFSPSVTSRIATASAGTQLPTVVTICHLSAAGIGILDCKGEVCTCWPS